MLEYPYLYLLQGDIFAFAISGRFIFEGCEIKTNSYENLRHWGLGGVDSIEHPS